MWVLAHAGAERQKTGAGRLSMLPGCSVRVNPQ
jgi:hypothetical protein